MSPVGSYSFKSFRKATGFLLLLLLSLCVRLFLFLFFFTIHVLFISWKEGFEFLYIDFVERYFTLIFSVVFWGPLCRKWHLQMIRWSAHSDVQWGCHAYNLSSHSFSLGQELLFLFLTFIGCGLRFVNILSFVYNFPKAWSGSPSVNGTLSFLTLVEFIC